MEPMVDTPEAVRYPIGKFADWLANNKLNRKEQVAVIENLPSRLRKAVENMTDEQLDTPYREGGWTSRQVVHHLVDSHMNSYVRFKLALTEPSPVTIKPYDEQKWAELPDAKTGPVTLSLPLLEGLHARWAATMKNMSEEEYQRIYFNPESGREFTLERALALYAWHCQHHLAHITELKKRKGW